MFRSIRGTLLFWYAVILVAVLAAFGATLYVSLRNSMHREIDEVIYTHALAIATVVEDEQDGFELEMSKEYAVFFQEQGEDHPYYVIWDRRGRQRATTRPDLSVPAVEGEGSRVREGRREAWVPGKDGTRVLVGRNTLDVQAKLGQFLGILFVAGAGVLLLALGGGWFLAGRVLAPVRRISEAASEISEANLSRRIDVERTESELGEVASTLNSAFDRLHDAFERQRR
ncbi:MAG: HAMP domain-containing protein [Planctomycetota bacterium]|jgi:HAMP domain-containing protein